MIFHECIILLPTRIKPPLNWIYSKTIVCLSDELFLLKFKTFLVQYVAEVVAYVTTQFYPLLPERLRR